METPDELAYLVAGAAMSLSTMTGAAGLGLGLAAGLFVGALTTYVAWTWKAETVRDLEHQVEQWTSNAAIAEQKAKKAQEDSQLAVDQLMKLLVENQQQYEKKFNDITTQISKVASATKQCLSPATVRLLNEDPRPSPTPSGKDPREILGLPARPPADPPGPARPPGKSRPPTSDAGGATGPLASVETTLEEVGGASEYEVARWINFARKTYYEWKEITVFLQGAIRAAPQCFEIVS